MNPEKVANQIIAWLQEKVETAGASGLVIGLSGGIDSALVAALCKRAYPDNCLGVLMPCHSQPLDRVDALYVANAMSIPSVEVNLCNPYDSLVEQLKMGLGTEPQGLALSNIKPRLRMITLYSIAAMNQYLVAGTGNRSEVYVGYSTKYGDAGTDLWPIVGLVKAQVQKLSQFLGVPERIINREPSAGLWPGQTDEGEMGFTYKELDHYILTGEGPEEVIKKIEDLHKKSSHKRVLPPYPELDLT